MNPLIQRNETEIEHYRRIRAARRSDPGIFWIDLYDVFIIFHTMNYERFDHDIQGTKKSIFLVNMTKELAPHFSELALNGIQKYLKQGKKI
jgi:hypothetical protein